MLNIIFKVITQSGTQQGKPAAPLILTQKGEIDLRSFEDLREGDAPPVAMAAYYLKGVAPPQVHTIDIYRGVVPFILMQVSIVISILVFPGLYGLD